MYDETTKTTPSRSLPTDALYAISMIVGAVGLIPGLIERLFGH